MKVYLQSGLVVDEKQFFVYLKRIKAERNISYAPQVVGEKVEDGFKNIRIEFKEDDSLGNEVLQRVILMAKQNQKVTLVDGLVINTNQLLVYLKKVNAEKNIVYAHHLIGEVVDDGFENIKIVFEEDESLGSEVLHSVIVMAYRDQLVESFFEKTGYRFQDPAHLVRALTRKSAVLHGVGVAASDDFEKYEFLGDSVLGVVVRRLLLEFHPEFDLGELNREYQKFTRNADGDHEYGGPMYRIAKHIGLEAFIIKSTGEDLEAHGVRGKTKKGSKHKSKECILADHMEAVLAAIYYDSFTPETPCGNLESVDRFIRHFWGALGLNEERVSLAEYGRSLISSASSDHGSGLAEVAGGAGRASSAGRVAGGAGHAGSRPSALTLKLAASKGQEQYLKKLQTEGELSIVDVSLIISVATEYGKNNVVSSLANRTYLSEIGDEAALTLIEDALLAERDETSSFEAYKLCCGFLLAHRERITRASRESSASAVGFFSAKPDLNKSLQLAASTGNQQSLEEILEGMNGFDLEQIDAALLLAAESGKHNFISSFKKIIQENGWMDGDTLLGCLERLYSAWRPEPPLTAAEKNLAGWLSRAVESPEGYARHSFTP